MVPVDEAARVDEVDSVQRLTAGVALIATSIISTAVWACTLDKTIRKEPDGTSKLIFTQDIVIVLTSHSPSNMSALLSASQAGRSS